LGETLPYCFWQIRASFSILKPAMSASAIQSVIDSVALGMFLLLPLASGMALVLFGRDVKRRSGPITRGRLIAGNVLGVLFLLSLLFIGGEAYYRFFYDTTDAMACTKVCERWAERYWRGNALECRDDREYPMSCAPDKRRVSFIGDSFTTGHGIKNIQDRFANRLRRLHPEWEVHVLARNGLDTGPELAGLEQLLARGYQINEVVLVYCLNDVADMMPEQREVIARIQAQAGHRGWLRENSYFADILYHRYLVMREPHLKDYYSFVRRAYQGPLWERQKQRLQRMKELVQSHGGHFSVVTFPFLHVLGPNYEYRFAHEELDQFWREQKVPHLDLLPVFKDLPPSRITVNRFDPHPNEYANQLAARAIDEFFHRTTALQR